MRKIVVTDLDGTLLAKDSYFRAIFKFGRRFRSLAHLPRLFLNLSMYAGKQRSRSHMKELSFRIFFKDLSINKLDKHKISFIKSLKVNQTVLDKVRDFQREGYEIYIVSASPDLYVKEITENFAFDGYLCTKVDWHNDRLSGHFSSLNCINEEKVKRINEDIIKDQPARIVAFGNSKGDYAMFEMSDEYYFVKNGKLIKNYPLK